MRIPLLLAVLCIAGCTKRNPDVCCTDAADCAAQGLPVGTNCSSGLLCRGNQCIAEPCTSSASCDPAAPYCVASDCAPTCTDDPQCPGFGQPASDAYCVAGACVACRVGMSDCPANAPVCDADACRTCVLDAECPSTVCDVDQGSCVAATSIRYAATDGVDTNPCSQAAPCTLAKAISIADAQRPWVRMNPGTYITTSNIVITNNAFTIVGTGATLTPSVGFGLQAITGADLTIRGLTMTFMFCQASTGIAAVTLRDVKLTGGSSTPTSACQLTLRHVDGEGADLALSDNTVASIDRSRLRVIYTRASSTASFSLRLTNSSLDNVAFSFSAGQPVTIYVAYNTFYSFYGDSEGCSNGGSGITFVNNIFYVPNPANGTGNAIGGTSCTFDTNIAYTQSTIVGTNTIALDPKLVDPANGDFHLAAGSPAIGAAKVIANAPTVDYDGTPRVSRDIGAFEYH